MLAGRWPSTAEPPSVHPRSSAVRGGDERMPNNYENAGMDGVGCRGHRVCPSSHRTRGDACERLRRESLQADLSIDLIEGISFLELNWSLTSRIHRSPLPRMMAHRRAAEITRAASGLFAIAHHAIFPRRHFDWHPPNAASSTSPRTTNPSSNTRTFHPRTAIDGWGQSRRIFRRYHASCPREQAVTPVTVDVVKLS